MGPEKIPSADTLELIEHFQAILTGSWKSQALYVAAELRLADLLATGPRTSTELASLTGAHPPSLHRLLQALSTIGVCTEREDDRFELTQLGSLLQEGSPNCQRAWTIWWGRHLWPVWGSLLHSVKTGESARKLLYGTDGFGHLDRDPDAAAAFYQVTVEQSRLTAQFVTQAYEFSGLKCIVDVGGGYGELLAHVLRANPGLSGILFDLPLAVEGAAKSFKATHPDIDGRCAFVAGDFFDSVPQGADAYILKSVIHDWDNERSAQILKNCRRAMAKASRLLVIEPILPQRRGTSSIHGTLSGFDLTMLAACGAQERTEFEYRDLLNAAGLQVFRIIPAGPIVSVIECFPARSP